MRISQTQINHEARNNTVWHIFDVTWYWFYILQPKAEQEEKDLVTYKVLSN